MFHDSLDITHLGDGFQRKCNGCVCSIHGYTCGVGHAYGTLARVRLSKTTKRCGMDEIESTRGHHLGLREECPVQIGVDNGRYAGPCDTTRVCIEESTESLTLQRLTIR